ncbi:MAG TPA: hypothetical protein VH092_04025 [Urbifossiella sp.]|jgi:hypothetical protein|nr:hypothetical protein [Urbifossiella sp.]
MPLIQELLADLPASHPGPGPRRHLPDSIPRQLADRLVVADGSARAALPHLVRATAAGDWKLHLLAHAVGGRVTMAAFRMLSFYLQGWADEDELKDFLSQLREREA